MLLPLYIFHYSKEKYGQRGGLYSCILLDVMIIQNNDSTNPFLIYEKNYLPPFLLKINNPLQNFFNDLKDEAMQKKFIGRVEPPLLWHRHIVDSLLPLQESAIIKLIEEAAFLVDLGAGAGLPSIPLAMAFPKKNFLLIDNDSKRIAFCQKMKHKYSLSNIHPLHGNADNPQWPKIFQKFSFVGKKNPLLLFRAFRKPLASLELALFSLITTNMPTNGERNPKEKVTNLTDSLLAKVLYYRSRPLDFSQEASERLRQLGYGDFQFYKFSTPPVLEKRGAYVFTKNLPTQAGFPRRFKKIKNDSLAVSY